MTLKEGLKKMPKKALAAIVKEITQLEEKKWAHPINFRKLKHKELRKIIRSSFFLKEKYLPNGEFDKLRGRLVAGGNMQDKSLYDDISSPTASIPAVFMVAAIAAKERRHVATMDIAGAYLNAPMSTGKKVLMSLDKIMTAILLKIKPEYKSFVRPDGTIVMELDKALYGCVESAKLWFELLKSSLEAAGYTANPSEPCVFNKVKDGVQVTCVIYVDDLFITSVSRELINELKDHLTQKFKEVTFHEGTVHSYLGMTFDFSTPGEVAITQAGYINDILNDIHVKDTATTPATGDLYTIRNSLLLSGVEKEDFHSLVARLLYLGKRTRPDILTAVSYLSTRVQAPTQYDSFKLTRVLKYLRGTTDLGLRLRPASQLGVTGYVDASYAVHADYKSHTGLCIQLGAGTIYAKSTKQKLNTKSSTEAEIVGLSDSLTHIIWCRDFLYLLLLFIGTINLLWRC